MNEFELMNGTRGSRLIHVKLACSADLELAPEWTSGLVPWRQDSPLSSRGIRTTVRLGVDDLLFCTCES